MTESCVDSEQEEESVMERNQGTARNVLNYFLITETEEESVMERNQETVRNVLNYIHEVENHENQRGTL